MQAPNPPHPLAAAILAADDRPVHGPYTFPEWGGVVVHFRSMNGADGGVFQQLAFAAQSAPPDAPVHRELAARAVVACACDADGGMLFTPSDVPMLALKANGPLQRAAQYALEASGLTEASRTAAEGN